jgi:hypothetical protein
MCTSLDCYSIFSPVHAHLLPTKGNGKVLVLGKLPYVKSYLILYGKKRGNSEGLIMPMLPLIVSFLQTKIKICKHVTISFL